MAAFLVNKQTFFNWWHRVTVHDVFNISLHFVLLVLSREWMAMGEWDDYILLVIMDHSLIPCEALYYISCGGCIFPL